ncbi:MAG: hypothetical protein ACTSRP_19140 [Candidatus Helarchaeota archaeon]
MARYYCNSCKKDITRGVFQYSMDKFGRALCINCQNIEREKKYPVESTENKVIFSDFISLSGTSSKQGNIFIKKIKKGVKKIGRARQINKWKDKILRRMPIQQLRNLCFENKISILAAEMFAEDWIAKLKKKLSLDTIISYANRKRINIKDILQEIEKTRNKWRMEDLAIKAADKNNNIFIEIIKKIQEFTPMRFYDTEIYYQDTLASFLKSSFPDTKIEVTRGSTRPDITINDIAIEVKGPTSIKDLQTISDKYIRYSQYFNGVICVLFKVNVSESYFNDWLSGIKNNFKYFSVIIK